MKFGFTEASAFKNFIKGVSNVADEITFLVNSKGLRCQVAAYGNVAMFDVLFKPTYFDVFEVTGEEYMKLVPSDISKILKTIGKDEHILFDVDQYNLHIVVEGTRRRNFNISLIDTFDDFRDLPSFELGVGCELEVGDLLAGVKDLELMGSPEIVLRASDDVLECRGFNDYKGSVECVVGECTGSGVANYNIKSFKEVIDFKDIGDTVEVRFDNNMPLLCEFCSVMEDVELTTLLAPIIKND